MGIIRLHNMTFYGYHGTSAAEKKTGRRFEVDCEMSFDLSQPSRTDRLSDTVDYTAIYNTVEEIILKNRFNLLETVATRLADRLLKRFPVDQVCIRVRKKIPPIPGNLDHIEVEVRKGKK